MRSLRRLCLLLSSHTNSNAATIGCKPCGGARWSARLNGVRVEMLGVWGRGSQRRSKAVSLVSFEGFEPHASKRKRSAGIGYAGSAGVSAGNQEGSADGRRCRGHGARIHSAQQFGVGRVHSQARQLRQILSPAQDRDSEENPFTGETILTKDRRKITFVSLGNLRQHEKVV